MKALQSTFPFRYKFAVVLLLLCVYSIVRATTPSPGHPWSQVGDGLWAATGTAALRTFTFPDHDADVLTDADVVQGDLYVGTAASTTSLLHKDTNATRYLSNRGASNQPSWSTVSLTNGVDGILPSSSGGTGNASTSFTGQTLARTYTLPDAAAIILTSANIVTLAQGGTSAPLAASNGGVFYSTASAAAILSGVATAGKMLRSGLSSAPTWSTATWSDSPGATSSYLVSDGTNWVSQGQFLLSAQTKPYNSLGTASSPLVTSTGSATRIGMFNLKAPITVNQISYTVTGTTNPRGTMKVCLYNEAGSKVIDITSASLATGAQTVTTAVSPAVTLTPGNYYITAFCSASCGGANQTYFGTTAVPSMNGASIPSGKKVYEGIATMTGAAGTCDSTMPAITGQASSTLDARLDN